jgi:hypothetical protein
MARRPKEEVTCHVMCDGVLHRAIPERRVVYEDSVVGRHVKAGNGRKYPLNASNIYEFHYTSVARAL